MMTNTKNSVDLAKTQDGTLMYEPRKEICFDEKAQCNKSPRDRSFIRLLKSSAIMDSGHSTRFLPESPNELCDSLKLLVQEKKAASKSNIIDGEIVAIVDKLLEYKCISTNQHKILLLNCLD